METLESSDEDIPNEAKREAVILAIDPLFKLTSISDLVLGLSKIPMSFEKLKPRDWQNLEFLYLLGGGGFSPIKISGIENLAQIPNLQYLACVRPVKGSEVDLSALAQSKSLKMVSIGTAKSWDRIGLDRLREAGVEVVRHTVRYQSIMSNSDLHKQHDRN